MSEAERHEALEYLRSPNLLERIAADIEACGMVGNRNNCLLAYLCALSRLTERPLGALIVSRSGAGKSFMQDMIAACTPEESVLKVTRMTGQALFYHAKSLKHKLLSIEEDEGMRDGMYAIRTLLSSQRLLLQTVGKDGKDNRLIAQDNVVEGPVSVLISTTNLADFDRETLNRFLTIHLDESTEQTRAILAQQDRMDGLDGLELRQRRQKIEKLHRTIQRLLRPCQVVNRVGTGVKYPPELLNVRREKTKAQTLIRSIALLHQHQRPVREKNLYGATLNYIEVTQADVDAAVKIAGQVLRESIDDLPRMCRDLLHVIHDMVDQKYRAAKKEDTELQRWQVTFTRKELQEKSRWSRWHLEEHLKELEEAGYIVQRMGKKGQRYAYGLIVETLPEPPEI